MERRLSTLEVLWRRDDAPRRPPVDWVQIVAAVPEAFVALTDAECREWADLMTRNEPWGTEAWRRLDDLDRRVDFPQWFYEG